MDKDQAKNRRSHPRRQAKKSTKIRCQKGIMGMGPNVALTVLDISEAGLCFTAKADVAKGEEVEIELEGPGTRKPIKRRASVAWNVALADGNFCLGVRLDKFLSYAELQSLA